VGMLFSNFNNSSVTLFKYPGVPLPNDEPQALANSFEESA